MSKIDSKEMSHAFVQSKNWSFCYAFHFFLSINGRQLHMFSGASDQSTSKVSIEILSIRMMAIFI